MGCRLVLLSLSLSLLSLSLYSLSLSLTYAHPLTLSPLSTYRSTRARASRLSQGGTRVLHDVFLSYILASFRDGMGLANLSLVDIGMSSHGMSGQGYAEFDGTRNLSSATAYGYRQQQRGSHAKPKGGDLLQGGALTRERMDSQEGRMGASMGASMGAMRVAHVGGWNVQLYARRKWPADPWREHSNAVLRANFELLQTLAASREGRGEGGVPEVQQELKCSTPPSWWDASRCVIATGEDWRLCEVT